MKKNKLYIIVSLVFLLNMEMYGSQIWRSMILPGWGEKKHNQNKIGNILLFTEYALWTAYFISNHQSSSYENDYRNHGIYYAGVDWGDKNDLFAANVGNFTSMQEYNEYKSRQQLFEQTYPNEDCYKNCNWEWSSREERLKYDSWRNKSKKYGERESFIIAGMLINRFISMIDVFIFERKNKIGSELIKNNNSMSLNIHYNF